MRRGEAWAGGGGESLQKPPDTAAKGCNQTGELRETLLPRYSGHFTTKVGVEKVCWQKTLQGITASREVIKRGRKKSETGLKSQKNSKMTKE